MQRMSTYRVLIAMPLVHDVIGEFDHRLSAHNIAYDVPDVETPLSQAELRERIGEYDGVLTGFVGLDEETFAAAERLDVVSQWGIGLDDIDLTAAERHGVTVYNTPGAFAEEIADVVLAYLTMLTRKLHTVDKAVRDGDWPSPRGTSLRDKTLGIIGVGNIGSAVARRAVAHQMDVVGYDVELIDETVKTESGIRQVSRTEVFEKSFAVSLHCPLTPETRKMVGTDELISLGAEGYLINTARGEIVDEAALINALRDGTIAGAALDVFETEPLPDVHPLRELENTVLGSHNAGHTDEAVYRTTERAVENLIAGLVGDDVGE